VSGRQIFQEILEGIRSDLKHIKNLFSILLTRRRRDPINIEGRDEVRNWISDVFLDKLYETHAKVERLFGDIGIERDLPIWEIKKCAEDIALAGAMGYKSAPFRMFTELHRHILDYEIIVEKSMGTIRKILHDQNWKPMKRMNLDAYILPRKRAKYVKAREELEKAKEAAKKGNWDEVYNHLRPAIDLSIKERFGFKRIHPMKTFLSDAEKHNLPLPSYTTIYHYFDEGSQRIHGGKRNTPLECSEALSFVARFIDRLDSLDVSKEEIEAFKKKTKSVE